LLLLLVKVLKDGALVMWYFSVQLAVGLLFPSLLTSDIFALPIENVLLVPDYTMEEIGRSALYNTEV
jgi:hypothetical protein